MVTCAAICNKLAQQFVINKVITNCGVITNCVVSCAAICNKQSLLQIAALLQIAGLLKAGSCPLSGYFCDFCDGTIFWFCLC